MMGDFKLPTDWENPSAEFSPAPFWFWNDTLEVGEMIRQLDEFQAHGVDAFVIHPRVGLPRHMGWMSRPLLEMMRAAIQQAEKRGMWVILYDEGMYPSGSSSGQVVAENPRYQCRGLARVGLNTNPLQLTPEQNLVATVTYQNRAYAIIDRPIDSVIRGLHFIHEDADEPPEDTPPAIDLLNPDAVACFIRLVYDRYFQEFGQYFGTTIRAIFTDEPHLLGRTNEVDVMPGTTGILEHVNAFLGYDFTPHLPALWDEDAPPGYRKDYERALEHRLQDVYYKPLYEWCEAHNIALTGHPAEPDATAHLRCFHIPGQDIVWRFIEPDKPSVLEGRQSTQAKAASSVMLHEGRRRNANEFCGAYGHNLTFEEMSWLANWLLVRGCNLLIPHAFYYSVRGPRLHERPPDVGLHSAWWGDSFREFAISCRRLSWLNTDSQHICHVAILGEHHHLPWRAAKVCLENQIDFNYVTSHDLFNAHINADGIRIANQHYGLLIVDDTPAPAIEPLIDTLAKAGRIVVWGTDNAVNLANAREVVPPTIEITPSSAHLRVRHVEKDNLDWYILFNESASPLDTRIILNSDKTSWLLTPTTGAVEAFDGHLQMTGYEMRVLILAG